MRHLKIISINLLVFAVLIGIIECAYSFYVFRYKSPQDIWLYENLHDTLQFDPVRGFFLTPVPSRIAKITHGEVEFVGTIRGNAQGFADRDDFRTGVPSLGTRRYAVFGDSFSAGLYMEMNWPDRAEDFFRSEGQTVELLNFSIDGGGLGNWASIIREIVGSQDYQIHGLIFAAFGSDVDRHFGFSDGQRSHYAFARAPEWDPKTHPASLSEAIPLLEQGQHSHSFNLSPEQFNEALAGRGVGKATWRFEISRLIRDQYWNLRRLYWNLADALNRSAQGESEESGNPLGLPRDQLKLMDEIRSFVAEKNIPVMVVYIGYLTELPGSESTPYFEKTQFFAERIGAEFKDGRKAFDGMTTRQIKRLWLPYDGHWAQGGSDVFAGFMVRQIKEELWEPSHLDAGQ